MFLPQKNVIEEAWSPPHCVSRIFLVPKPNGKKRLIIDLSPLNEFLRPVSYHLPTIRHLKYYLNQPRWLAKLDLKDAYHHVLVHPEFRTFLAFRWGPKLFWFRAMPFGLSIAPAVFTGLMGFPLKNLREDKIFSIAYLDDWLIGADSEQECRRAVDKALRLFQDLGFLINRQKSVLTPTQHLTWLGVEWDASAGRARIPWSKILLGQSKILRIVCQKQASRRQVESIIGDMAFIAQTLEEGALRKKFFQLILRAWPGHSRDEFCPIPRLSLADLQWWLNPSRTHSWSSVRTPDQKTWLWTDASLIGWGAHTEDGAWMAGNWNTEYCTRTIAELELWAIWFALKGDLIQEGVHVRVHTDSVVAFWTIRSWGSKSSRKITEIIAHIFDICKGKSLTLEPVRIPGSLNVVADALSRDTPLPGEWRVDESDWRRICNWKGPFQVDLMATPFNTVLPTFVSPFQHSAAVAVDAKMVNWNQWQDIYVFPPPSMLQWVLKELLTFRGKAVVVARVSRLHPLFPALQMQTSDSLVLHQPPFQTVRQQMVRDGEHASCPWTAYLF